MEQSPLGTTVLVDEIVSDALQRLRAVRTIFVSPLKVLPAIGYKKLIYHFNLVALAIHRIMSV